MKNNKVLSTLLMMTAMTSMVAGALSINSNVYRKVDAVSGYYRIVYLYVPGTLENPGQVTKTNGTEPIKWDQDNALSVNEIGNKDGTAEAGDLMSKISNQLYAYVVNSYYSSTGFYFTSTIGGVLYWSVSSGNPGHKASEISDDNNMYTLSYYNTSKGNAGSWSGYTISTAQQFANTFVAVGHVTCDNDGNTEYDKLSYVWGKMKELYNGLAKSHKDDLQTADKNNPEDPLKDFAALYDTIYEKYGSRFGEGSNFAGRSVTPKSIYNPSVITGSSDNTNIIVIASISGVSLSIVGLYFFLRKRKEDK